MPSKEVTNTYMGVEYTFEVNGDVYGGFCEGNVQNLTFPQNCSVLYNPRDPRENALEYVDGIDKDDHKNNSPQPDDED